MDHMLLTYLDGLSRRIAEIKKMLDERLPERPKGLPVIEESHLKYRFPKTLEGDDPT